MVVILTRAMNIQYMKHFPVDTRNSPCKRIPGKTHLVIPQWIYKGWSHFGPLFGPVLAKYVGLRNEMDAF